MSRHTNIFTNLNIIEDDESTNVNIERKATKKLREIESLKKNGYFVPLRVRKVYKNLFL